MNTKKLNNGFTLMEVIIYTTILSITGTILSGVLLNTTRIKSRQTAVIEVNEQLNFVLQNIQRSIMDSSLIDISNSVSTSTLVLRFKDENKNPTQFYIQDNKVYKKEASGAPQQLTDDSVIATAVNFLKVSGYSGHDSLQIDLTLSYNTNNPASAFSRTLSSAIARVSAATFDSSLIPGTNNLYDVGLDTTKWKNLYVAGKTSFGGVEYTWPATAGTNGQNLSTNGVGVLSWATPPGYWAASGNNISNTNTGNVGIGTTVPGSSLQVAANKVYSGGYSQILVTDATTPTKQLELGFDGTSNIAWLQGRQWSVGYMPLILNPSGGNVGVGSTTPSDMLSIGGSSGTIGLSLRGDNAACTAYPCIRTGGGGSLQIDSSTASGAFGKLLLNANKNSDVLIAGGGGNVGIGTTAPVAKLDIASSYETGLKFNVSGFQTQNIFSRGTPDNVGFYHSNIEFGRDVSTYSYGSYMAFKTEGKNSGTTDTSVERMRIISTGNVGIGTTAPGNALHLVGGTTIFNEGLRVERNTVPTQYGLYNYNGGLLNIIAVNTAGTGTSVRFLRSDNGTATSESMRIDTNGNVGIGTTAPAQKLDVSGTIRQLGCTTAGTLSANASGDIICTSDERLKNIYGYYQNGLDTLSKINPIRFSYKGEDFVHVGFSAQNVKSVLPEASALQKSGYWSLDDTSITALTVNAIKEQQKQIEGLKNRISELEAKIK